MPRAGWVKPETDQRLSDHISLGVLTRVFPPDLVDLVVTDSGRTEVRHRLLPARVVVYYVLALALFSQASYEEVMRNLVEGLSWSTGWARSWRMPTKVALSKARTRLGPEPLQALFEAVAAPLATPTTKGAFYRGWRLVAIDGTCVDLADTPENDAAFGRPGTGRGQGVGAFPQVRMVGVAECGTHALVDVAVGPCHQAEKTLATRVLRALHPGMLLAADRGFFSFELWQKAAQRGAPGALRNAVRPLRHPVADAHRGPRCGSGPGSAELHQYPPGGAPDHGIASGLFPLRFLRPPSPRPPRRSSSGSSQGDRCGPTRGWSSGRCRTTQ